jgi:hypothetical protein
MTARRYITRAWIRQIADGLTPRDRVLLHTVAKLNIASERQLRQLRGAHSASERRLFRLDVARLVDLRMLARLDRRIGGVRAGSDGYVYALDVVGQRVTDPDRRSYRAPWTPQPMHLRHALAVSQLYVDLASKKVQAVHLRAFDAEPSAWRSFLGPGGARLVLKPDAFVLIAGSDYQDRMFLEIDRATESLPRIVEKAKTYVRYFQSGREQDRHGVFPLVVWIAPQERRASQLVDALSHVPAEHWRLFAVTTDATAVDQLLTGFVAPSIDRKEATT